MLTCERIVRNLRVQHSVAPSFCVFSSFPLAPAQGTDPKKCDCACSGASTLKDQYLGQVPGGRGGGKNTRPRAHQRAPTVQTFKKVLQGSQIPRWRVSWQHDQQQTPQPKHTSLRTKKKKQPVHSSVGRASDCRPKQISDGPWFDSG